jgi:hypothetical protein
MLAFSFLGTALLSDYGFGSQEVAGKLLFRAAISQVSPESRLKDLLSTSLKWLLTGGSVPCHIGLSMCCF